MITVAKLIEQLQALPQDAFVLTEGCDCDGPCSGAIYPYKWHTYNPVQGNPFVTPEEAQPTHIECVLLERGEYNE